MTPSINLAHNSVPGIQFQNARYLGFSAVNVRRSLVISRLAVQSVKDYLCVAELVEGKGEVLFCISE